MLIPTRMLLKFAYDGTKFFGYQRQQNVPTVEGDILKALKTLNIAETLRSASRTDRGVSALGNVIHISTDKKPADVIGMLNSHLHDIYFYAYSDANINPRHAHRRWYRYHLYDFGYDLDKLREAAEIFTGFHDFKYFTRARKNTTLEIYEIAVSRMGKIICIDFHAQNYVWNLIRRIVAAMIHYQKNAFGDEVFKRKNNFGTAPPEPLILMDVSYKNTEFVTIPFKRKLRELFSNRYLSSFVYYYLAGFGENYKSFEPMQ